MKREAGSLHSDHSLLKIERFLWVGLDGAANPAVPSLTAGRSEEQLRLENGYGVAR